MTKDNKTKWGTPQEYGELKVKYIPTGEIKKLKLGIRRMPYHNELIFCESWGYDKGNPTDLNNPDNYEVIGIVPKENTDSEVMTNGEFRKLMADRCNNLPSDDSELIREAKDMVKQIDDRQDYVSRRVKSLRNMMDQCKEHSKITKGKEREDLLMSVEIGRAKIDELKLLKKRIID